MYDKTDNNMHDNEFEAKENKIWNKVACEQALLSVGKWSEPRENARARGRGKESLQPSLINFHFHPGNPGTPQSVKIVTANVRQIRKVTTACQVSLDSRGHVELFIHKSLLQQL